MIMDVFNTMVEQRMHINSCGFISSLFVKQTNILLHHKNALAIYL